MAYPAFQNAYYPQPTYQNTYYPQPMPDNLPQLRQNQVQPTIQPQPIQPPVSQQTSGMIWISGKAEADSFPIAPGNAVALWDSNNPVVYLRQADSTGKPSTKIYDLVERTDNPKPEEKQIDLSGYMTKEEFSSQVQDVVRDVVDEVLTERLKRPSKASKVKEED